MANDAMRAIKTNGCLARPHNLYKSLRVDRPFSFLLFLFTFDVLVDGYNSLHRNPVRYYLLFRARDKYRLTLGGHGKFPGSNPCSSVTTVTIIGQILG